MGSKQQQQTATKKTAQSNLDPRRASLMGQMGGNTTVARYGGDAMGRWVNAGLARSWERKADPNGVMTPRERAQAVEALKQAHYAKMRLARWSKQQQQATQQQKKAS